MCLATGRMPIMVEGAGEALELPSTPQPREMMNQAQHCILGESSGHWRGVGAEIHTISPCDSPVAQVQTSEGPQSVTVGFHEAHQWSRGCILTGGQRSPGSGYVAIGRRKPLLHPDQEGEA